PVRRPGARAEVGEAGEVDTAPERLQPVQVVAGDRGDVREYPAKVPDRRHTVHRLPAVDDRLVVGRDDRVVLVAPARLGDEGRRLEPDRVRKGHRAVSGELADPARPEKLAPEELPGVGEPPLEMRKGGIGLEFQEGDPY